MLRRRFLRLYLPAFLLTVAAAYALASWDWCGAWGQGDVPVVSGAGEGPLSVGVGVARIETPSSGVVAGYPPPRPDASRAELPLHARALVLRAGETRVGLLSVELLTMPESLVAPVRRAAAELGLSDVWIAATHAHSSMGGYDPRLMSELAGTGRYREEAANAAVTAAVQALKQAAGSLAPATLEVGEASAADLSAPRDDEPRSDGRVLLARFRAEGGKPLGELILLSLHPTLRPRGAAELSPDYPGHLARLRQEAGFVSLVLQSEGGNARASLEGHPLEPKDKAPFVAQELSRRLDAAKPEPTQVTRLAFARATVALPRPDSSRLVPAFFRPASDNFLCASAPKRAEVGALEVGPLRLLSLPGEPTAAAGAKLEAAAQARPVSLANGYVGYINTPEHVRLRQAESRRQYFGPELLDALERAAKAAAGRLP